MSSSSLVTGGSEVTKSKEAKSAPTKEGPPQVHYGADFLVSLARVPPESKRRLVEAAKFNPRTTLADLLEFVPEFRRGDIATAILREAGITLKEDYNDGNGHSTANGPTQQVQDATETIRAGGTPVLGRELEQLSIVSPLAAVVGMGGGPLMVKDVELLEGQDKKLAKITNSPHVAVMELIVDQEKPAKILIALLQEDLPAARALMDELKTILEAGSSARIHINNVFFTNNGSHATTFSSAQIRLSHGPRATARAVTGKAEAEHETDEEQARPLEVPAQDEGGTQPRGEWASRDPPSGESELDRK